MLRPQGDDIQITKDKLGREILDVPATGPLWIYNRCVKNMSTTILDHLDDLSDIYDEESSVRKSVLALLTDGGPDWSPKSNLNQFFLGRFWKDKNLDMLISICFPPGLSRYNPIEHLWSPCSKWLAGVSIPACLPDETVPPTLQSIDAEQRAEKERAVFNNALDRLNMYWNGNVHDNFRVSSIGIQGTDGSHDRQLKHTDFEEVREMFKAPMKSIKSDKQKCKLLEEWRYYVKHMDRRWGLVCFRKGACGDISCDCTTVEMSAKNVMKLPNSDRWLIPPITPDPENPGHYMTFRQLS